GRHRQVVIDGADGGAVEPDLAMACRGLGVLHLDAVLGVGTEDIALAVDVVARAGPIPEVDVQPLVNGVVVDLPERVAIDIAAIGDARTPTQAGEAEVEARVGLGLGSTCQVGIQVDVLPAGVGEGRRVGATVDHRRLYGRLTREGGYRRLTEVAALEAI